MTLKAVCFVDMPFGKKRAAGGGVEVDFDKIYETAIEPAIAGAGLVAVRGDREQSGGIIHKAMFGRLLLSDYVVADLTLANPNVFYELGVRHTARPFTTVPIFATLSGLPFDVGLVRAIPYELKRGRLTRKGAGELKSQLGARLRAAIEGAPGEDSPLFQLIEKFPQLTLPKAVRAMFEREQKEEKAFLERLAQARELPEQAARLTALGALQTELGELKTVQSGVLVALLLTLRDESGWAEVARFAEALPEPLRRSAVVRQQWALALNRLGRSAEAQRMLEGLVKEQGADAETLGILGRVYKDRYKQHRKAGRETAARGALEQAIRTYQAGFESDPRDYYPGVNALTLLVEKGDEEALEAAGRLAPLVSFAVARQGGAGSDDYWTLATTLEVSAVAEDWAMAARVLPRVVERAPAAWMAETTRDNLRLLVAARRRCGRTAEQVERMAEELDARAEELRGRAH